MLKDLIAKGVPFHLLVLKVGDLYVLHKGVGHFFLTLHGTMHSVIGMQTVLKRPPPTDVSTVTREQFAELCTAFASAGGGTQEASSALFELKASAGTHSSAWAIYCVSSALIGPLFSLG